jgi:hypothetical protein
MRILMGSNGSSLAFRTILEAQLLMLASHILNPANGAPSSISGYGLGSILYDQRKIDYSEKKILGQDLTYSAEEVNALNEGRLELNARVELEQKILMTLEN